MELTSDSNSPAATPGQSESPPSALTSISSTRPDKGFSIGPLEYEPLLYIVQNMRAVDREEIFATHYDYDEESDSIYAASIIAGAEGAIAYIAYNGSEPVAVIGLRLMWPGVASVWMFATEGWLSVCFALTRFARRTIIPLLQDADIHRAQCWSQDSHYVSHRWLESLGATHETMVPGYGKNGEAFCLFAWVKGRDF